MPTTAATLATIQKALMKESYVDVILLSLLVARFRSLCVCMRENLWDKIS